MAISLDGIWAHRGADGKLSCQSRSHCRRPDQSNYREVGHRDSDDHLVAKGPLSRCDFGRDALSYGGLPIFVFLPLAFGSWWALRGSHRFERAGWMGLFALSAGEWAWQVTYPAVTEGDSPSSCIIAFVLH